MFGPLVVDRDQTLATMQRAQEHKSQKIIAFQVKIQKFKLYFKLVDNKMELIGARAMEKSLKKDEGPSPPPLTIQLEDKTSTTTK